MDGIAVHLHEKNMRKRTIPIWMFAFCLSGILGHAQEKGDVEQIKKQLQQMQENFEKVQRDQREQIEGLKKQIEALQQTHLPNTNAQPGAPAQPPAPSETKFTSLAQPMTLARSGASFMNISFDALMDAGGSTVRNPSNALQLGDHDPINRGFTLPNSEIVLDGAVDPYFNGLADIVFKLDKGNETQVEAEEVYLQSSSLPYNLQLKAGQFFANFGRQNSQHPHQWAFVDAPLILTRTFGPEGFRNLGTQLSWLLPTPFYTEAFLGVFDGSGNTSFSFRNPELEGMHGRTPIGRALRGPGDLLLTPRIASSFELTDTQTLVVGASAALGPNDSGPHNRTEIYGLDAYWKWKPANAQAGFPFVSWQTEGLYQRFGAGADSATGLSAENLRDWGFYSQLLWGFRPQWVIGLRGDYVDGNSGAADLADVFRGERMRVAPNLTWYPSEFTKFRLQYNYDDGELIGTQHSVWLQMEFLLGAHAAHKF